MNDEEFLLRTLFNPQHIKNGEVVNAAIPTRDLLKNGFSLHRMQFVTPEFVEQFIEDFLARPRKFGPWISEGVAQFRALQIRQIRENGNQLFVIIDTASTDNPGHASLYIADTHCKISKAKEYRTKLLPLLQNLVTVDQAYAKLKES